MSKIKRLVDNIVNILIAKCLLVLLKHSDDSLAKYRLKVAIDSVAKSRGFNDIKDAFSNGDDETLGIDRNSRTDIQLMSLYLEMYDLCGWN